MAFLDLLPMPRIRYGSTLAFSKLYFYEAETLTPLATYSDPDGLLIHKNTNPLVADSTGLFGPIFILPLSYKVILKTSADLTVYTQDNVRNPSVGASFGIIDVRAYGAIDDNLDASAAANQTAIQAAINASYGKALYFPIVDTGIYKYTGPLTIDATNLKPIRLFGDGVDAFGGFPGRASVIKCIGAANGLEIVNLPFVDIALQQIVIEDLVVGGDGVDAAGGHGIYAIRVANLQLRNMWVRDFRENGIYFDRCFGSQCEAVITNRNRRSGFYSNGNFHLGRLIDFGAFSNGRTYSSDPIAGIFIGGSSGGNSTVRIESPDIEGQGQNAFTMYKRSDNTLTSIVVLTNVATVNTPTPHGRSIGERVMVKGATVDTDLNSATFYTILAVPTTTSFTFATAAVANATYTEATLYIGPWVPGIYIADSAAPVIENFYGESGNSTVAGSNLIFAEDDVAALSILGGYLLGGTAILNSCDGGTVTGVECDGTAGSAGIVALTTTPRDQIDVSSSNRYVSGATLVQPAVFKQDGKFYSVVVAAPATGTWALGDIIWFTNAVSGGPPGIYCTVAGSPGTWKAFANLA